MNQEIYLLCYFCRYSREEKIVIACSDRSELQEFARTLNDMNGYVPQVGLWGQDCRGIYSVRTVPAIPTTDLYKRLKEIKTKAEG